MERARTPEGHPFCLSSGTRVEDWSLEGCRGHGAYGVVYRAVRVGQETAGPVALKVALFPWDPRFMREVALLSLIRHSSVPRLLGQGFWRQPGGTIHPFIVMDWVEGTPLYDWAREHDASSGQLSRLLAHLARALEATHVVSAVHRDVKGGNVLVRRSDGRAILTDYGSGNYQATARLTWQSEPPGTPAYRSPEAGLFTIRSVRSPGAHYVARPADDVFALGVTAYRLVTGEYPAVAEPQVDDQDAWYMEEAHPLPPHQLNPRVDPRLSALILRMLSLAPEARGTAGELAAALEDMAEQSGLEAAQPPSVARGLSRVAWSALALVCMVLVLWTWGVVHISSEQGSVGEPVALSMDALDAGTAVGETVPMASPVSAHESADEEAIGQETPPEPFPGQTRPDERGHCPGREQVLINGVCWAEHPAKDAEACEQNGYVFLKERCYAPAFSHPRKRRQPTSSPADFR